MELKNLFRKKTNQTYRSMWRNAPLITINSSADLDFGIISNQKKTRETRIERKPIEIWESLVEEKPNVDCKDLNNKIKAVKQRIKILEENSRQPPTDEYEVLGYLEARRKYARYIHFFQWPITIQKKINELTQKYAVQLDTLEHWYTLIPEEGILEITKYRETCKKVRPEKPDFRLIVPVKNSTEKEQHRRDPILLASSPFGRWDFILGAWDKEVAIVDELIYEFK